MNEANGQGPQPAQTSDTELTEWRRVADEGSSAGECSGEDLRALIARLDAAESKVDAHARSVMSGENVYRRFIEEMNAMTIQADDPVAEVVGQMIRAVKRAQMVVDGELRPATEREPNDGRLKVTHL